MTVFDATHKFKGREYVPLEDAIALDRAAVKAKWDNTTWDTGTYKAKVTETTRREDGGPVTHSEATFETGELELAQHWIRDKKIELSASPHIVRAFLYESKIRQLNSDGTARGQLFTYGNVMFG